MPTGVPDSLHDPAQLARALMDFAAQVDDAAPLLDAAKALLAWAKGTPKRERRGG